MVHLCPECDQEMDDENQGHCGIQWDYPHFVCVNPACPKNPKYNPTIEHLEASHA